MRFKIYIKLNFNKKIIFLKHEYNYIFKYYPKTKFINYEYFMAVKPCIELIEV